MKITISQKNYHLSFSRIFNPKTKNSADYFDHIRLSTIDIVANEINSNHFTGNVAEADVYTGGFAKYLNFYFPNRKLYLFDTFEGFDKRDVNLEKQNEYSTSTQIFSNTSVNIVLKKMQHPEQCIIRKGYFPKSAINIDDNFVFVSLDTDLFAPIYEGLNFFYPRLVKGGCIFIHDFNNDSYKGARKAVELFCKKQNIGFLPLADIYGTAVISK